MVSDQTTFFLAFTAVFGGLAVLMWRIEATARRLEERLAALEASAGKQKSSKEKR